MKILYATLALLLIAVAYADTVNVEDKTKGFGSRLSSIATIVYVPEEGKR